MLQHGLLRGRFVPPVPIRELRDLTRYRKGLIQERVRETQRLQKVLEDAGVKLASVATDILEASGRAMLDALVQGGDGFTTRPNSCVPSDPLAMTHDLAPKGESIYAACQ